MKDFPVFPDLQPSDLHTIVVVLIVFLSIFSFLFLILIVLKVIVNLTKLIQFYRRFRDNPSYTEFSDINI